MFKLKYIVLEILAGTSLFDAKLEAIECAIKYKGAVMFKFNGVKYEVDPVDVVSTVKEVV